MTQGYQRAASPGYICDAFSHASRTDSLILLRFILGTEEFHISDLLGVHAEGRLVLSFLFKRCLSALLPINLMRAVHGVYNGREKFFKGVELRGTFCFVPVARVAGLEVTEQIAKLLFDGTRFDSEAEMRVLDDYYRGRVDLLRGGPVRRYIGFAQNRLFDKNQFLRRDRMLAVFVFNVFVIDEPVLLARSSRCVAPFWQSRCIFNPQPQ